MKFELFTIGPFHVYGYGFMIAIGIFAAYFMAEYRAKKLGLNEEYIFELMIWALLGGFLGSRCLYYLTSIPDIIKDPGILIDFSDGYVVYGGILGGILGGLLYCKRKKADFLKYFDLVMPSVALAQGFGRIGCFLAGCCYGMETTSPIGVVFPESSLSPSGVALVPTQLISSGLDFVHCAVLLYFVKKQRADGQVAGLYLILYSIGRFILEFFRGDLIRGSVGALSTSQFISIFTLALGVGIFIMVGKRKVEA